MNQSLIMDENPEPIINKNNMGATTCDLRITALLFKRDIPDIIINKFGEKNYRLAEFIFKFNDKDAVVL